MGYERRTGRTPATEGRRSPAGVAGVGERGGWSSGRKNEVVLRTLRGEDIDALSRELGVTDAKIAGCRDRFLDGGQANLKTRQPEARDEESLLLRAKVGELMMDKELLEAWIDMIEGRSRPRSGRSRP